MCTNGVCDKTQVRRTAKSTWIASGAMWQGGNARHHWPTRASLFLAAVLREAQLRHVRWMPGQHLAEGQPGRREVRGADMHGTRGIGRCELVLFSCMRHPCCAAGAEWTSPPLSRPILQCCDPLTTCASFSGCHAAGLDLVRGAANIICSGGTCTAAQVGRGGCFQQAASH
jgi:hypothetical protein